MQLVSGVFIVVPVTICAANPVKDLEPTIATEGFFSARICVVGGVLASLPYDRFVSEDRRAGSDEPG